MSGLNPTWNHFNVAPVGPIIMVGHRRALQGGITRESALNLIAWLAIAAEATPEEIQDEISKAYTPNAADVAQVPGHHPAPTMVPTAVSGTTVGAAGNGSVTRQIQPGGQSVVMRPSPTMNGTPQRPNLPGVPPVTARPPGAPLTGATVAIHRPSPRLQGREDDSAAVAASLDVNAPPPHATVTSPTGVVLKKPVTPPPARPASPPARPAVVTAPKPPAAPPRAPEPPPAPAPDVTASTDGDPNTVGPETIPFLDPATLDPDTRAALAEAEQAAAAALAETGAEGAITPVNADRVAAAWSRKPNGSATAR